MRRAVAERWIEPATAGMRTVAPSDLRGIAGSIPLSMNLVAVLRTARSEFADRCPAPIRADRSLPEGNFFGGKQNRRHGTPAPAPSIDFGCPVS